MYDFEKHRRTGRTTRMLEEAEQLASQGKAVYVVCKSRDQAKRLNFAFGVEKAIELGIKFESLMSFHAFDWDLLQVPGSHPNCVFLLDHHLLEYRFGHIVRAMTKYDKP